MRFRRIAPLLLASATACGPPSPPDASFVRDWIDLSRSIVAAEGIAPPAAARLSAYGAIAMYEGHAADPASNVRSLAGQVNALWSVPRPGTSSVDGATIAAAAHRVVLDSLLASVPAAVRSVDSLAAAQIAERRSAGVSRENSERSVEHGQAIGRTILAWAATDGFLATRGRPWTAARSVAQWAPDARRDPPAAGATNGPGITLAGSAAAPAALEPHWGRLRTFALRNADECAPPRPPAYSEQRASEFWKMGRELQDSIARLTPEKAAIAKHWLAQRDPAAALFDAAYQVLDARESRAADAAEAHVLYSIAVADAYIGAWREKYRAVTVRPATYLQRVFGSARTLDVAVPATPEYPSDHAVVSAAAAGVLVAVFGDTVAFVDSSAHAQSTSFRGFTHARDEIARAGVYAGLQFVPSVVNGQAQGACIGQRVGGRVKTRGQDQELP